MSREHKRTRSSDDSVITVLQVKRVRKKKPLRTHISRLVETMVEERGGSAADFARLAQLTPPQLSRIMRPTKIAPAPGVLTCLKLSRASGMNAAFVLRVAGHDEYAVLIEYIVGRAERPPEFTTRERQLIMALRNMDHNERSSFTHLIMTVGTDDQRESPDAVSTSAPRTVNGV